MLIKLPQFEGTSCHNLTACGKIESGAKVLLNRLTKANKPMVARCRVGAKTVYIRVLPSSKSGKHLHIDCALKEFFNKRGTPEVTHKRAQVMALLDKAIGATIDVGVIGFFVLPLAALPERGLVRSLYTEQATAGMTIKLTGGRFSITGAPVQSITWGVQQNSKDVALQIQARKTVRIEATYLQELLDWINGQLGLYLLTRGKDGSE